MTVRPIGDPSLEALIVYLIALGNYNLAQQSFMRPDEQVAFMRDQVTRNHFTLALHPRSSEEGGFVVSWVKGEASYNKWCRDSRLPAVDRMTAFMMPTDKATNRLIEVYSNLPQFKAMRNSRARREGARWMLHARYSVTASGLQEFESEFRVDQEMRRRRAGLAAHWG